MKLKLNSVVLFLSRDAIITFPEGSVQTTVSVKYAKFTREQLPEIVPENGQNIAVNKTKFFL